MTKQEFQENYQYDHQKDLLGVGKTGTTYKAFDTHQGIEVAIKVVEAKPSNGMISLLEATEMAKKISHVNITYCQECYRFSFLSGVYDFGILRYYEEGNLQQLLDKKNLSFDEKDNILKGILAGLHYLHDNQIIHFNLKPNNILLMKDEVNNRYIPKITDFGFGVTENCFLNTSAAFDNYYFSPEQFNLRGVKENSDLWSFGVIAYQVFIGQLPFISQQSMNFDMEFPDIQISRRGLPDEVNSIPEPWQTIIKKCLILDPQKRIKHCADCEKIFYSSDVHADEDSQLDIVRANRMPCHKKIYYFISGKGHF